MKVSLLMYPHALMPHLLRYRDHYSLRRFSDWLNRTGSHGLNQPESQPIASSNQCIQRSKQVFTRALEAALKSLLSCGYKRTRMRKKDGDLLKGNKLVNCCRRQE